MKMKKGALVTLDDNKKYIVVDLATFNNIEFAYLTENESNDFIIQRVVNKDNEIYFEPVNDKEEFDTMIEVFFNRNKKLLNQD